MRFNTEGLFIKISGVTTEEDALFAIGLGATAVGFDFGPTMNRVSVTEAHDIVRRLPGGALSVGSFRDEMPQRIVEIANTLGLSAVQIDGVMSANAISYVAERVNTVLRSYTAYDVATTPTFPDGVDYLVAPEFDDPEALQRSLALFGDSSLVTPIIASGGLNASNVVEIVQNYPVWGVDVRSGVEVQPGMKDPVLLGQFIDNARWAFDNAYVDRSAMQWPD